MRKFFENKIAFATISSLFALAFALNFSQGATAPSGLHARPAAMTAAMHGPTMPPNPWDGVRVGHGPTMPPNPWDGLTVAAMHGPTMPPNPWDGVRVGHGPTMPPNPWDGMA
jgi:hypothetical protein